MQTVLMSFTSTYSVFLFTTLSNKDGFVNHLATERAKAHRRICSPMIKVGALLSLAYHSSLSPHLHSQPAPMMMASRLKSDGFDYAT